MRKKLHCVISRTSFLLFNSSNPYPWSAINTYSICTNCNEFTKICTHLLERTHLGVGLNGATDARAHSFGQFKKHALLKARTQSLCFSYPVLARAFISAGSTDLLSSGGASVGYGARFTVLVASLWTGENAAGLFAYCWPHRLTVNFLYKINVVAFYI